MSSASLSCTDRERRRLLPSDATSPLSDLVPLCARFTRLPRGRLLLLPRAALVSLLAPLHADANIMRCGMLRAHTLSMAPGCASEIPAPSPCSPAPRSRIQPPCAGAEAKENGPRAPPRHSASTRVPTRVPLMVKLQQRLPCYSPCLRCRNIPGWRQAGRGQAFSWETNAIVAPNLFYAGSADVNIFGHGRQSTAGMMSMR